MTDTTQIKRDDTGRFDGRAVSVRQTSAGGLLVETTDHVRDGKPVAGKPFRAEWIKRDQLESHKPAKDAGK